MYSNFKAYRVYRSKTLESEATVSNMSISSHVEKRYDDIIKSQNDDRLYRGLVLANKMKVLLISDPTTDKSAVALDVNIGNLKYTNLLLYRILLGVRYYR